jgi:hypothetical protein
MGWVGIALVLVAVVAGALWWWTTPPRGPGDAEMAALYATPLPAPEGPLAVYHIGHSLVNRDMPAMLAQLAGEGHRYESQLGWGAPIRSHWGDIPVNGFDVENAHPRFREAREAVASGDYDAIVLTEAVEIRDMIRYHDSSRYLALFAAEAWKARPDARVYLYETWHPLDSPPGWLERIDGDLPKYWEGAILRPALGRLPEGSRIFLIPGGQALAALVREIEAQGGVGGVADRTGLFGRTEDGGVDQIHLNDLGNYFIALLHYSVLYHRNPEGLPHALLKGDGTPAEAPSAELAQLMQRIAWDVARANPLTGVGR